jgi:hypothetical protein
MVCVSFTKRTHSALSLSFSLSLSRTHTHIHTLVLPQMVASHTNNHDEQPKRHGKDGAWRPRWWWKAKHATPPHRKTLDDDENEEEEGATAAAAASGAGTDHQQPRPQQQQQRGQRQQQHRGQRRRPHRPSIDELPPAASTAPASYPSRQFPPLFLLLLTALLALCLVALWRQANDDMECLIVPGFPSNEGMRAWMARAYDAWRQRAARARGAAGGGRAGTRMCYSVVRVVWLWVSGFVDLCVCKCVCVCLLGGGWRGLVGWLGEGGENVSLSTITHVVWGFFVANNTSIIFPNIATDRLIQNQWRCAPVNASQAIYPFVIRYKQTRVSTLLQVRTQAALSNVGYNPCTDLFVSQPTLSLFLSKIQN